MAIAFIYAILSYAAIFIFVAGFLSKIWMYASTPVPLVIPTTPAPLTQMGANLRVAGEVLFFSSLFKGNKWTWAGGMAMHAALALTLLWHLRYFLNPLPEGFMALQAISNPAGYFLPAPILYLFFRRLTVDRTKYISMLVEDYLLLMLILGIALTGILMHLVMRPFVIDIKTFIISLLVFRPVSVSLEPMFLLHYTLVLALLVYFPFSKLMHVGGIFFTPTRNMANNPRTVRHINPWDKD
jgi:nitrate reductase gamma subunit